MGDGTIYDDDLNIYWLQNANLAASNTFGVPGILADGTMNWTTAQTWITAMNTANHLSYSDWRLPATLQPDPSCSSQSGGIESWGYNCSGSEMGHLYYTELGNPSGISGGNQLNNTGPFSNLRPSHYWSGTEYAFDPDKAWGFGFNVGVQGKDYSNGKGYYNYALAVRPGDVSTSVPEPATLLLMGSGLAGIAVWRKRLGRREG